VKQASAYCPVCEKRVYAVGKAPNHVLHFLLTIFTFGLWLVVWVLLAAGTIGNYRCTKCGAKVSPSAGDAGRYGRGKAAVAEDDED